MWYEVKSCASISGRGDQHRKGATTWPVVVHADPGSILGSVSLGFWQQYSQGVHLSVVWTVWEAHLDKQWTVKVEADAIGKFLDPRKLLRM